MSSVKSGAFSLINHSINIIVTIGSLSILGRLLTPEDFGLIGIVLAVQTFFQSFLDLGLKPTFIKLPSVDQKISNVFYSVNFYLGIIIVIIICCIAPFLAIIYNDNRLLPLTIVFSISILIQSLCLQRIAVLSRKKLFDKRMIVSVCGLVCGTSTAIIGAIFGLGVWALVIRRIANSIGQYISARLLIKKRYHLVGLKIIKQYKEKILFGVSVVVSELIGNILISVDKLIFGKFYDVDVLGYYTQASRVAIVPDSNLRMALTVPALAHLARNEKKQNSENYLIMCTCILFIAGIPCLILILIGDWILPLLLGCQWIDAGTYMQILGIWGFGKVLHGLSHTICLNEMKMINWIKINLISFPIILFPPTILFFKGIGPIIFVFILSSIFLIYWTFVLISLIYKVTGDKKASLQIFRSIFLMILTIIPIGFFIENNLINFSKYDFGSNIIRIGTTSVAILLSIILIQILFNRKYTLKTYTFIKSRIR